MKILSQLASAFRTFLSPASDKPTKWESYDADLNQMGWLDPRQHVGSGASDSSHSGLSWRRGSTSAGDARAIHPTGRRDAANRRRIESQPLHALKEDEKQLALALAQSAIMLDGDVKKSDRHFDIQLGIPRGPRTREEKMAAALASSVIEMDPELKGRGVQFDVRALPPRVPTTEDNNLALALALSAIEHDGELSSAGMKFKVEIGSPRTPMTEAERLAHGLGCSAIESEFSLKNLGLQLRITAEPSSH